MEIKKYYEFNLRIIQNKCIVEIVAGDKLVEKTILDNRNGNDLVE